MIKISAQDYEQKPKRFHQSAEALVLRTILRGCVKVFENPLWGNFYFFLWNPILTGACVVGRE